MGESKIKVSEKEVLRACREYLDWKGIFYFRVNQIPAPLPGGGFRRFQGTRGVSDLIAVLPPNGRICCIETKSGSGRESESQKEFPDRVVSLGGISIVVHSLDELEADLREAGVL